MLKVLWSMLLLTTSTQLQASQLPEEYSLQSFQKTSYSAEDFKGKPLVLQFWAPWCHSCSSVLWDIDPILSDYQNVRFLSINIGEDTQKAKSYIEKHRLFEKYKHSFFTNPSQNLLKNLAVVSVPTVMVVNRSGHVVYTANSHMNAETTMDLKNALEKVNQ